MRLQLVLQRHLVPPPADRAVVRWPPQATWSYPGIIANAQISARQVRYRRDEGFVAQHGEANLFVRQRPSPEWDETRGKGERGSVARERGRA